MSLSINARQFIVRERFFFGPVLYVRRAEPTGMFTFQWGKWRKATLSEIRLANTQLEGLQILWS